jgi:hypothetical protein
VFQVHGTSLRRGLTGPENARQETLIEQVVDRRRVEESNFAYLALIELERLHGAGQLAAVKDEENLVAFMG